MPQAIHTEQLTRRFGRITAVDCVNLDVPEGALYALVGQNGAGKTTTIKLLMNLIPATKGSATILGTVYRSFRHAIAAFGLGRERAARQDAVDCCSRYPVPRTRW
jgi:ABC-type multidrug transport system ATPase subunit